MGTGTFITFEGGEGAGKSTHIGFLSEVLAERGYEVLSLREPGGTSLGEALRELVLDPANTDITAETELLIYEAARAQIVSEVIVPALARGAVVVCDRFSDSTIAYQAYGRGVSAEFVRAANEFACQGVKPDRTILMKVEANATEGLERATHHGVADRIERAGAAFHTRVNDGFMEIAKSEPERVRVIISDEVKSHTARRVFAALADIFPWMADATQANDELFARIDTGYYGNKREPEYYECEAKESGKPDYFWSSEGEG